MRPEEQQLSTVSPVAQTFRDAAAETPEVKAKKKQSKDARSKHSFIRQPPGQGAVNPMSVGLESNNPAKTEGPSMSMFSGTPLSASTANAGEMSSQQSPDEQSAVTKNASTPLEAASGGGRGLEMVGHQQGVDANAATPSIQGMNYDSQRDTGPILLTNVGPGNKGGRALGNIGLAQDTIQNEIDYKTGVGGQMGIDPSRVNQDGSLQAGNMDVKFNAGTDPEAMKRFMRDPNYIPNRRSGGLAQVPRQQASRQEAMPQLITKKTHPGIDSKTAQAMNAEIMRGYQARQTEDVRGANSLANVKQSGQNTLANSGLTGAQDLEKQNEKAALEAEADARALVESGYQYGAPMSEAADKFYKSGGKEGNISDLGTVPRRTDFDKKALPHYVEPQFDNNGDQRPGTGEYVMPPGSNAPQLSKEFNPKEPSADDAAVLKFYQAINPAYLEQILSKYNLGDK